VSPFSLLRRDLWHGWHARLRCEQLPDTMTKQRSITTVGITVGDCQSKEDNYVEESG
jgi:hypothetical protein